jgi:hypothetical protein
VSCIRWTNGHRGTSQFLVSVHNARIRTYLDVPAMVASSLPAQGVSTVDTVQAVCEKLDSEEKRSCA